MPCLIKPDMHHTCLCIMTCLYLCVYYVVCLLSGVLLGNPVTSCLWGSARLCPFVFFMDSFFFLAGSQARWPWYVSNISIIFVCSMLYYLLFWTLLGIIIHFYIIFGTNLLTGGPAQDCCFLPVLGFRRKGKSNGGRLTWNFTELIFGRKEAQ